ncbi:MAG: CpsD/CapB family tyrosine-protein kinase [Planctomycetes bacterium]|nr:CpsD/CapB family tyrosine-protein kinase [Planctomycetota bacterium]
MSTIEEALKKMEAAQKSQPGSAEPSLIGGGDIARVDERIVAYHQPDTALTERFKQFNVVLRSLTQGINSTLAFTSASKGEGKSIVASNFAVALAHDSEGAVCIVDADLRSPSLHDLLGVRNTRGFTEVLERKLSLEAATLPTPVENLSLIPAGRVSSNPSELLSSSRTAQIVAELRGKYDYVVFDTAPVLTVTDTIHLVSQLDAVVIVIKAGHTSRNNAKSAVDLLLGRAEFIGFILNKSEQDKKVKAHA